MVDNLTEITSLLQLASPMLPVGGYTYSEGLETLVELDIINDRLSLEKWLTSELARGAIRIETAIVSRVYDSMISDDLASIKYWNNWLSASRETSELRQQSWQMGGSLMRLLKDLINTKEIQKLFSEIQPPYNYPTAYAITSYYWSISVDLVIISYLQGWLSNLVNAGVKLIPLGQTDGQKIIFNLRQIIQKTAQETRLLTDDNLYCCSWGLTMASMQHETLYSRLFRS